MKQKKRIKKLEKRLRKLEEKETRVVVHGFMQSLKNTHDDNWYDYE